jgi:HAD superfamily hydrolase (TIGR01509 family)
MTIEAILWDNDGVLVDTESLYFQATREILATVGVELPERTYVQLFLVEGRGAWHLARERGLSAQAVAELTAKRNARYSELLSRTDVLLGGVAEALSRIGRRYRMAIVTSSTGEHFHVVHRQTGLLPHFEFSLTREHYVKSKPDPEPYLLAVERLRLPKERCLVVEDSERGLLAAKAAGLTCWVVPRGLSRHGSFALADRVLDGIAAVEAALLLGASG